MNVRMYIQQVLWLHKRKLTVTVSLEVPPKQGEELMPNIASLLFHFDPHVTVKEAIQLIISASHLNQTLRAEEIEGFGLFLPTPGGLLKMEENRKLLFYRINSGDVLKFTKKRIISHNSLLKSLLGSSADLLINIQCPDLGVEKVLRLNSSCRVSEVITRFTEKHPLANIDCYNVIAVQSSSSPPSASPTSSPSSPFTSNPPRQSAFSSSSSTNSPNWSSAPSASPSPQRLILNPLVKISDYPLKFPVRFPSFLSSSPFSLFIFFYFHLHNQ